MGLVTASDILSNDIYRNGAELCADYLVKRQDLADGAWYDQYSYATKVNNAQSLRHTAEVMIAFDKLGFNLSRYESMKKAAQFILDCQNVSNKQGNDDGLVAGGKQADGTYHTWRWTSDNAFSYQALMTAANWATLSGEIGYGQTWGDAAARISESIQNNLFASPDHWVRVIDKDGNVVASENRGDWICYSPLMLDLPLGLTDPLAVGQWIHNTLQHSDGSVVWDDTIYPSRQSPGFSFQAMLAWLDTGQTTYANNALFWAENSGLWQRTPDGRGVTGGWIDWREGTNTAEYWQRFIDTSAYYIMAKDGGYNFNPSVIPEFPTIGLLVSGLFGLMVFHRKINTQKK